MRSSPRPVAVEGWAPVADSEEGVGFSWLHVPANTFLRVVVLSTLPTRYVGHWSGGRLRPCAGTNCEYHARRLGSQVRYVLSVYDLTLEQRGLLELGEVGGREVRALADLGPGLRGLALLLRHEGGRPRGRIQVLPLEPGWELATGFPGAGTRGMVIPPAQDCGAALTAAWVRMEQQDPDEVRDDWRGVVGA